MYGSLSEWKISKWGQFCFIRSQSKGFWAKVFIDSSNSLPALPVNPDTRNAAFRGCFSRTLSTKGTPRLWPTMIVSGVRYCLYCSSLFSQAERV